MLFPCSLAEIMDGIPGNVALKMGIDDTGGEVLPYALQLLLNALSAKRALLQWYWRMRTVDAVLLVEVLEHALCIHGLF
jgi:hypothetical protein